MAITDVDDSGSEQDELHKAKRNSEMDEGRSATPNSQESASKERTRTKKDREERRMTKDIVAVKAGNQELMTRNGPIKLSTWVAMVKE